MAGGLEAALRDIACNRSDDGARLLDELVKEAGRGDEERVEEAFDALVGRCAAILGDVTREIDLQPSTVLDRVARACRAGSFAAAGDQVEYAPQQGTEPFLQSLLQAVAAALLAQGTFIQPTQARK